MWWDDMLASFNGSGVGGQAPSFGGGDMSRMYGPASGSGVTKTNQNTSLPVFGMPGQTGGTVGQNGYDTSGLGSNLSTNDLLQLGAAGMNILGGKGGAIGGLDTSKLSSADTNPGTQSIGAVGNALTQSAQQDQQQVAKEQAAQQQQASQQPGQRWAFQAPVFPGLVKKPVQPLQLAGLLSGQQRAF